MTAIERRRTDILVLGAGGAGLLAALHAKDTDPTLDVTIAVKGLLGKCGCTRMVQGGYNVAIAAGDSAERHFMDTLDGGKWLNDQDLAWTLVVGAQQRIRELENRWGCFFDRNADGSIHQKAFAGQTFDRTVHKGDLTGIEIVNRLAEQVWARGINRLEEHRAVALIRSTDGARLSGVLLIDMRTGALVFMQAKAVLLGHRRRPDHVQIPHAIGRQGLRRHGDGAARRPAAARHGDGAVPPDRRARRPRHAHDRHHHRGRPARRRRLPARRRWRALHAQIRPARRARDARHRLAARCSAKSSPATSTTKAGCGSPWRISAPSASRANSRAWSNAAPTTASTWPAAASPVVPTAHYMMGGLVFRADGSTDLPGLFAAGEDTGGVHGANRLGGNGVANSTVFGGIAGDSMGAWVPRDGTFEEPDAAALDEAVAFVNAPFARAARNLSPIRDALLDLMWDKAGILRDAAGLAEAATGLDALEAETDATGVDGADRAFNLTWHDWLNLKSQFLVSRAIVAAAQAREESRGAHWREDFPHTLPDTQGLAATRVTLQGGTVALGWQPVAFTRLQPGQSLLAAE